MQRKELEHAKIRFKDYKSDVTLKVSADIASEKEYVTKEITRRAEDQKNKELGSEFDPNSSPKKTGGSRPVAVNSS